MDGVKPVATPSMPGPGLPRVMMLRMQHKVPGKLHIKHLDRIDISESNLYVGVHRYMCLWRSDNSFRSFRPPWAVCLWCFIFPSLRLGDGWLEYSDYTWISGSTCACLPSSGLLLCITMLWDLGMKLRSSYLLDKHLTHWVVSPWCNKKVFSGWILMGALFAASRTVYLHFTMQSNITGSFHDISIVVGQINREVLGNSMGFLFS